MNVRIEETKTTANGLRTLLYSSDDRSYYVVSTVRTPDGETETLVFPARSTGQVIEHTEVAGGCRVSHEQAIAQMRAMSAASVAKVLESAW